MEQHTLTHSHTHSISKHKRGQDPLFALALLLFSPRLKNLVRFWLFFGWVWAENGSFLCHSPCLLRGSTESRFQHHQVPSSSFSLKFSTELIGEEHTGKLSLPIGICKWCNFHGSSFKLTYHYPLKFVRLKADIFVHNIIWIEIFKTFSSWLYNGIVIIL